MIYANYTKVDPRGRVFAQNYNLSSFLDCRVNSTLYDQKSPSDVQLELQNR